MTSLEKLTSPAPTHALGKDEIPLGTRSCTFHENVDPAEPEAAVPQHHWIRHSHHRGFKLGKHIRVRPLHILSCCWRSASPTAKTVNMLWPLVPVALGINYGLPHLHLPIFILSYLAMIPCANLIGFAAGQIIWRLPKVFGHVIETTITSTPELILLLVLVTKEEYKVAQAAILGSILATLLLCLGICFTAGGLIHSEQHFDGAVSEMGSDLLLTAGMGLIIPGAFHATQTTESAANGEAILIISRVTAILLLLAYLIYLDYQMRSHKELFESLLESEERKIGRQSAEDREQKLCFAECLVSLTVAMALVTVLALNLVDLIPFMVNERGLPESFLGLVLVPIVEKVAEHISTVGEALNDHMSGAVFKVLGSTIHTAMFNTPIVVLISWIINKDLDLVFETFNMIVLILAILVVGSFTKDLKSNYLEGALCITVYLLIALGSYFE